MVNTIRSFERRIKKIVIETHTQMMTPNEQTNEQKNEEEKKRS